MGTVKKRVMANAQAKSDRKWNNGNHMVEQGILGQQYGTQRLQKLENGLTVKKEEFLTPPLHIKIKSPPTPCLHYPPSSTSSSHFHSIDPNDFVWSNSPSP